jgi:hypothetical protein
MHGNKRRLRTSGGSSKICVMGATATGRQPVRQSISRLSALERQVATRSMQENKERSTYHLILFFVFFLRWDRYVCGREAAASRHPGCHLPY